ncbi:MAG TPA: TspO/MBR family protein [Patescibacteria group bacterium]|nr:TspO/MBR family protein [Patescibacteria group bacterium]
MKKVARSAHLTKLVFFIFLAEFVGVVGSLFTLPVIPTWYASLNKPFFTPPTWLFGPVWVALYALMGIASFMIWEKKKSKIRSEGLVLFFVQLILTAQWSIVFFGLQSPLAGMTNIIAIWCLVLATILKFFQLEKRAAYLLFPYYLWVSFATVLNVAIVLLNY